MEKLIAVARCTTYWGDLGALLVLYGAARDCPAFSDGRYSHLPLPESCR